MKKFLAALIFLIGLLEACSPGGNPVQTAIVNTLAAKETNASIANSQTQMAVSNIQLTQNVVSLAQSLTQNAIIQTQAALNAQQQVQNALSQTQVFVTLSNVAPIPSSGEMGDLSTPVPGVNSISTTGVDFTGARVYSQGSIGNRQFMVVIQLSDKVKEISGKYFLETAGKKYKCSTIKSYPNRLYCIGASPRGGYHAVRLYEDLGGPAVIVFVTDIILPEWTPTFVRPIMPSPTN